MEKRYRNTLIIIIIIIIIIIGFTIFATENNTGSQTTLYLYQ